jgi:hypothetical protein
MARDSLLLRKLSCASRKVADDCLSIEARDALLRFAWDMDRKAAMIDKSLNIEAEDSSPMRPSLTP